MKILHHVLTLLLLTLIACLANASYTEKRASGNFLQAQEVYQGKQLAKWLSRQEKIKKLGRTASECCVAPNTNTSNQLEVGKVDSYKESKKITGDGSVHRDHQPSVNALYERAQELKGSKLTSAEKKRIKENAQTVIVTAEVHQAGPTYGGKNTTGLSKSDAADLQQAARRDSDAMVENSRALSPEHTSVLKEACNNITCMRNSDYDDFLLNQLDE